MLFSLTRGAVARRQFRYATLPVGFAIGLGCWAASLESNRAYREGAQTLIGPEGFGERLGADHAACRQPVLRSGGTA